MYKLLLTSIATLSLLATPVMAQSYTRAPVGPSWTSQSHSQYNARDHRRDDRRRYNNRQPNRYYNPYAQNDYRSERWYNDRQFRTRNDSSALIIAAGIIIGSLIIDNQGVPRQYYMDRDLGTYYYYDYRDRQYYWDPGYRPHR